MLHHRLVVVAVTLALASACSSNRTVVGGPADADTDAPDAPDVDPVDSGSLDLGPADVPSPDVPSTDAPSAPDVVDVPVGDVPAADVPPTCDAAQALCDGRCVDPASDPAHCGACGRACQPAEVCGASTCRITCPAGQSVCGASCVTLATDALHCGDCDTRCAVGAACVAGACQCPTGQVACIDRCVDTATSPTNCGACGLACALAHAAPACAASTCRVVSCEAGFGDCDGMPANGCEAELATDATHCGGCGLTCSPARATARCTAGACGVATCEANFADCDAAPANGCEADTRTDARNCGGCGTVCATGRCVGSSCAPPRSCLEQKMLRPTSTDGRYTIDPDGAGIGAPIEVYCDMTTAGGGWTYVATVTNLGDAADTGSWLVTSPTPNAWESTTATFGTLDPTANADYRSMAFVSVEARALMVTHRSQFLLATDDGCLQGRSLQASLARLDWTCGASEVFARHPECTHACVIASSTPRAGDAALLNGVARTRLYLKAGEADGAQDTNRDRTYLSTSYRDNVDFPTGLGAFCSGSACSPRAGGADVNDRSDAITPGMGTEFYGLWVR